MKMRDILKPEDQFLDLVESGTSGGTVAGNVASVANPMGNINRRPSLFGYIPYDESEEEQEKPKKSRKRI
jgi:hypothetical protein